MSLHLNPGLGSLKTKLGSQVVPFCPCYFGFPENKILKKGYPDYERGLLGNLGNANRKPHLTPRKFQSCLGHKIDRWDVVLDLSPV